ncbi:MAG: TetR/AcrR family transcriptional regulator [Anaerolineae bacterium]
MSSDTRNTILHVASRLFVRQGYTATSIRQIAEEAGIGKATVYHHFANKEAIVLALVERDAERTRAALKAVMAERDPRRRIESAVETCLHFFSESADIIQVIHREVPGGRERTQAGFLDFYRQYVALLAEAIAEGTAGGAFRAVEPEAAARVLMDMIHGAIANAYLSGELRIAPDASRTAAILGVFFQGIEKH